MALLTAFVPASEYDGCINYMGTGLVTNAYCILTNIGSDTRAYCYFEDDFSVLKGKTIESAILRVYGQGDNNNTCNCKIYGEIDPSTPPTDVTDLLGKTLTTAYTDWPSMPGWNPMASIPPQYDTVDFAAAIQETIDDTNWNEGTLAVHLLGYSISFFVQRYFHTFDSAPWAAGGPVDPPQLRIIYS